MRTNPLHLGGNWSRVNGRSGISPVVDLWSVSDDFSVFQHDFRTFQMISAKIRVISGGQNHSQRPFSRGFRIFERGVYPPFWAPCRNPWKSRCFCHSDPCQHFAMVVTHHSTPPMPRFPRGTGRSDATERPGLKTPDTLRIHQLLKFCVSRCPKSSQMPAPRRAPPLTPNLSPRSGERRQSLPSPASGRGSPRFTAG
jgi:hypothetical protein